MQLLPLLTDSNLKMRQNNWVDKGHCNPRIQFQLKIMNLNAVQCA